MANRYYKKPNSQKAPATGHEGPKKDVGPVKTASWPGLPGKVQSKDRSAGYYKCKDSAKSEGL